MPTIEKLKYWIQALPNKIYQFSEEELLYKPRPDKWSKKEILGHLIDSGINNWQRFVNAQFAGENFVIRPYSQSDLVKLNFYQNQPIVDIVELWLNINRQILVVIEKVPPQKLSQKVILPNSSCNTLEWLIQDYVVHMEHHFGQLFSLDKDSEVALPRNWKITVESALKELGDEPKGKHFSTLLENGKMYVEIYAPDKVDLQIPHDQDEIYVIISGSGTFFNNGERVAFKENDVLFVPKGIEHRFENFTDDFKTWVIFY